jgi:hypothetical protein
MCRACTSNDHCGEGEACADYACQPCDDETTAGTTLCGTTESVLRCDGTTVSVVGSLCDANGDGMHDAGRVCQEGECIVTQYAISVDYQMVYVVPKQVLLRPVLTDLDGIPVTGAPVVWQYAGWMPPNPKATSHADLGQKTVTITAKRANSDDIFAQRTIQFRVNCKPENNLYGPCCVDGGLITDGQSSCDLHGSDDLGFCNALGQCVEYCAPQSYKACQDNAIYWYDGCDNKGDLYQDCGLSDQVCRDAQCADVTLPCEDPWVFECRGQDGVKSRCGVTQAVTTCDQDERCVATDQDIICEPNACGDPSLIECGSRCVDPLTSRTDCGDCNVHCENTELCDLGSCVEIPGCFVVCDENADCNEGYVCINAGDCFESECQPVNLLENEIEDLSTMVEHDYLLIDVSLEEATFAFRLINLAPVPLKNVSFDVDFPKAIVQHADQLTVSNMAYDVLDVDPKLRFTLPNIDQERTFTVAADHVLDASTLAMIDISNIHYEGVDALALAASWNKTKDALRIGINSEFDGEKTKFHLTLDPSKSLFGLTVPLEIPKCLADYASEMDLPENVQIIKEDPLIAWEFDELNEPVDITFSVPKEVNQECLDQLRAMAFARNIGKPLSPWLALLLVPVLALTLIFFQRFGPNMQHAKLIRQKEYFQLGRAQGMSDEQIEREWRDFKRRF